MVVGLSPVSGTLNFLPVSKKEFLEIQVNIECGFTLKYVYEMIRT